jgi:hypothetical protein
MLMYCTFKQFWRQLETHKIKNDYAEIKLHFQQCLAILKGQCQEKIDQGYILAQDVQITIFYFCLVVSSADGDF